MSDFHPRHTEQTLWELNRFTICFEPVHGLKTGSHTPRVGAWWSQKCSPGHNICGPAQNVWSGLHHYLCCVSRFKASDRSALQLRICEPVQRGEPAHNYGPELIITIAHALKL